MKNVFIEGLGLVEGHFSGVGQYILGIVRGIDELIEKDKIQGKETPNVRVIIPCDTVEKFKKYKFKHIGYKAFPMHFRYMGALDHRNKLPPLDLICGQGFYVFTRFAAMPLMFSKYINIVYDLSFEVCREYSDEANARYLSPRTRMAVDGAVKVITISNSAKKEIVDFYNIDKNKILVATPAADQHTLYRRGKNEIEVVKKKYGIKGNYILALSNLEPRKNLEGLVDAYCDLPKTIRDKTGLLLVGVTGWKADKLFKKIIAKVNDGFNIMRPSDYVSDDDKPAILSGADMLVYPSHYEGFGMPPLEALACGTPVITSNNSSLPEVVGKCGIMVNSSDTKALKEAIILTIKDSSIKEAAIVYGPKQAEKFNWNKSAKIYYDTIKENI